MKKTIKINNSLLGKGHPTYIVAEISCNHKQDLNLAIKLIHEAKKAGANAVKFQTYTPDTLTLNCDNEYFKIKGGTIWDGKTLYELYNEAYTPWDWFKILKDEADKIGIDFFSSVFDETSIELLESLDVPVYKIASFEVTDHIILKKVAKTGKPVILSTGICELPEIAEAVNILKNNGCHDIIVLKCTSAYPASIEDANLKTIKNISKTFDVLAGLSDHTLDIEVPIVSVCLGACFIEKHFTLSRNIGSHDDKFSLEPLEFKKMVDSVRKAEKAIGKVKYKKSNNEKKSNIFRRSLFVTENMKKGDIFTEKNVKSIRPGYGLHTRYYDNVIGSVCTTDIVFGTPLEWQLIKKMKILFLGNCDNLVLNYLKNIGEDVEQTMEKINTEFVKNYDFIISYGYRHIIKKNIIDLFPRRIINLHISYLPWNKGADPNLWSFIDDTPKGVTIHHIDQGVDTGDIIVQKLVHLDNNYTLKTSYDKLQNEIQELFKEKWQDIKNGNFIGVKQNSKDGSIHRMKDKEKFVHIVKNKNWNIKISDFLDEYNKIK